MEYELAMEILQDRERAGAAERHALLHAASSTAEVLVLVREFLGPWTPSDIDKLPPDCQPGTIATSDDVALYAFRLVSEQCSGGHASIELHRMATFFATASQRISQILAHAKFEQQLRAVDVAEWWTPVEQPIADGQRSNLLGPDLGQRPAPLDVEAHQRHEPIEGMDELPVRQREE